MSMSLPGAGDAHEESAPIEIDVVRGEPSAAEIAALIAVIGETYAAEAGSAVAERPRRSRWELSARGLRAPLARERGWNGSML